MERYSKKAFLALDGPGRSALCLELADVLSSRLRSGGEFHSTVSALVAELRAAKHDLWSFDELDDAELWCPNWQAPTGPGLAITFRRAEPSEVTWSGS